MARRSRSKWRVWLGENLVLRVVGYYLLLAAVVVLALRLFPGFARELAAGPFADPLGSATGAPDAAGFPDLSREAAFDSASGSQGFAALLASTSATLLALPVAWLYILTRRKKGYRQSVVQTLVLLPLVVAGVVVLVKNSLALAFSLAGIVAAVRFRNTLEDSKDAVYIFLATGIGLAAGVQVSVAVVLSVLFNAIILFLWYTDFGRTPANLEGRPAEQRLERALAIANRTGAFVARLDNEILKSMSPEQLDAVADRAWRRRRRSAPDWGDGERPDFNALLRVRTAQVDRAREAVEPVLGEQLKRWRFGGVVHEEDGTHVVEYGVQLKKSMTRDALLEALRSRGAPHVLDVDLR
jgi:hypothetical protein